MDQNPSTTRKWIRESHVFYHPTTAEVVPIDPDDPKELLAWSDARQEAHKQRLMRGLMQGRNLNEVAKELGINKFTLATWRDTDERIGSALTAWEQAQVLVYEERFDDVFFHPERYDKALSRPAWFNFAISRLKAMSQRYKDNIQVNVDARSIQVGGDTAAALVAQGRNAETVIEGVKKQLLSRAKAPPTT